MSSRRRDALVPAGLSALALVLALVQHPGRATADTKIDLHVDAVRFLGDVVASWSPTYDLGHVQGGQYGGYLLPMGPFFALGDLAGAPGLARAAAVARPPCWRSPRGGRCG